MRSLYRSCAALLALMLAAAPGAAQPAPGGFDPRTGDAWVDTRLDDINRYGSVYRDPFVDELARFHKAPRDLVLDLLGRPGWTPGDVYFACALAVQVGRPCRYVAEQYERERGAGWGALAQRLGIAPGSPAFHRLKRGFVPTYDRWGRPIQLDDDLRDSFPGRGRPGGPRGRPDRSEFESATAPPARAPADGAGGMDAARPEPTGGKPRADKPPAGKAKPARGDRPDRDEAPAARGEGPRGKRGRADQDDRDEE